MRTSIQLRLGAALASVVALGAALLSGPPAVAAPAPSPQVTCQTGFFCAWSGPTFNGLKAERRPVPSGQCTLFTFGARSALNQSFEYQRLWTGAWCTGTSILLAPGSSRSNLSSAYGWLGGS
ncbi:peptidase inhibitor family I36 protein [Streptomyces sp. NPDC050211]|uniref:peptidase inhibitor family I36 protein n=1 Tax=Streptomyces sp. NPDC050211 TaxID=3154932 RepID=UPI003419E69A